MKNNYSNIEKVVWWLDGNSFENITLRFFVLSTLLFLYVFYPLNLLLVLFLLLPVMSLINLVSSLVIYNSTIRGDSPISDVLADNSKFSIMFDIVANGLLFLFAVLVLVPNYHTYIVCFYLLSVIIKKLVIHNKKQDTGFVNLMK